MKFVEISQLFRSIFETWTTCCPYVLLEIFQNSENVLDSVKEIFIQKSWSLEYVSEKATPESENAIGFKKSGSYRKMLLLLFLCILFCENETFRI